MQRAEEAWQLELAGGLRQPGLQPLAALSTLTSLQLLRFEVDLCAQDLPRLPALHTLCYLQQLDCCKLDQAPRLTELGACHLVNAGVEGVVQCPRLRRARLGLPDGVHLVAPNLHHLAYSDPTPKEASLLLHLSQLRSLELDTGSLSALSGEVQAAMGARCSRLVVGGVTWFDFDPRSLALCGAVRTLDLSMGMRPLQGAEVAAWLGAMAGSGVAHLRLSYGEGSPFEAGLGPWLGLVARWAHLERLVLHSVRPCGAVGEFAAECARQGSPMERLELEFDGGEDGEERSGECFRLCAAVERANPRITCLAHAQYES